MPSTERKMPAVQSHRCNCGSMLEVPPTRRSIYRRGMIIAAGIAALALSSAAFYRVRELLSALILFGFLFGALIFAILILWLLGETTHRAAAVLETQMPRILPRTVTPALAHSHTVRRGQPWN